MERKGLQKMTKTDVTAEYLPEYVPVEIMETFTNKPPGLEFIWPGFLAETVGALVAPGATGKSFFALEAVMSIACSVAGGDLVGLAPTHIGRVVYFAGEDPLAALKLRVHAIGQHLNPAAREAIAKYLTIESIMSKRLNLMNDQHLAHTVEFCTGARLIVLDTLSRMHNLEENSNGDMAQLIATLEYIAVSVGASVLYLHHVSKGSARLINNAHWCGYVAKMTEQEAERLSDSGSRTPIGDRRGLFVRFGVSKQNCDVLPLDRWYQRHNGGVLLPAELREIGNRAKKGNETARNYDFTHARHDRAHCLTPEPFRSLKRGDRKKLKLDVTYTYGDGEIQRDQMKATLRCVIREELHGVKV